MPQATFQFPAGFLWGCATSSHQVEGNNTNNNWAAWEAQPGRIVNDQKSGLACDWWGGRWKEDFERAAETNQNAHRMSVEWSRIQPAENRWDENALDHYREMLQGLIQRNITPLVTLHHFTDPVWLSELGGWENEKAIQYFAAFVNKTVEALKEYCNLWVTFNEPNIYAYSGYIEGVFPPGKKDMGAAFRVMSNMLKAHAQAYREIHKIQPTARVGIAQHFRRFSPARPAFAPDAWVAGFLSSSFNESFLNAAADGKFRFATRSENIPAAAKTQDFVGVNYYTTDLIKFNPLLPGAFFNTRAYPPGAELSGTGYIANVPTGLFDSLQWATRFNLPLIVTENGVEDAQDSMRPRYLVEHLHQIWRGINFNWPIKGYFHWSLVDNFEWERGWTQRFGLWGLDIETQRRVRRTSVDVYAEICKNNAISSDMVAKYAPQAYPRLFPG
jgi:beta-glucosidase